MRSATHSALYVGAVRHRRFDPVEHEFRFPLFMVYVDLAELPAVLDGWPLCSARRPALAWFRRADYFGDRATDLDAAVRDRVEAETSRRPAGPIRLLTYLRAFGHQFSPVSFYYCFDRAGERVEAILAEITNTPWKERHAYVLDARDGKGDGRRRRWRFDKAFHVSPFMPMGLGYDWTFTSPGERAFVHMNLTRPGVRAFDATLLLRRRPLTGPAMASALARFPGMTVQVVARIHFEALRLWIKGAPVHPHPRSAAKSAAVTQPVSPHVPGAAR